MFGSFTDFNDTPVIEYDAFYIGNRMIGEHIDQNDDRNDRTERTADCFPVDAVGLCWRHRIFACIGRCMCGILRLRRIAARGILLFVVCVCLLSLRRFLRLFLQCCTAIPAEFRVDWHGFAARRTNLLCWRSRLRFRRCVRCASLLVHLCAADITEMRSVLNFVAAIQTNLAHFIPSNCIDK